MIKWFITLGLMLRAVLAGNPLPHGATGAQRRGVSAVLGYVLGTCMFWAPFSLPYLHGTVLLAQCCVCTGSAKWYQNTLVYVLIRPLAAPCRARAPPEDVANVVPCCRSTVGISE